MTFVMCEIESIEVCTEYEGQVYQYDVYVQCSGRRLRLFDPGRISETGGLEKGMAANLIVGIGFTGDCVVSDSEEKIKVGADEYQGRIIGEILLKDIISPRVIYGVYGARNLGTTPNILVQTDFGRIVASSGELPKHVRKKHSSILGLYVGFVGAPRLDICGALPSPA